MNTLIIFQIMAGILLANLFKKLLKTCTKNLRVMDGVLYYFKTGSNKGKEILDLLFILRSKETKGGSFEKGFPTQVDKLLHRLDQINKAFIAAWEMDSEEDMLGSLALLRDKYKKEAEHFLGKEGRNLGIEVKVSDNQVTIKPTNIYTAMIFNREHVGWGMIWHSKLWKTTKGQYFVDKSYDVKFIPKGSLRKVD